MGSDGSNDLGLRPLWGLADLELHTLTLVQALEAIGLDCLPMDEDISAATIDGDEAEALVGVEPFDGALCHELSLN